MLVVAWLTSCTDAPSEEQVVPSTPNKVALRTPSEAAAIAVDVKQGSATDKASRNTVAISRVRTNISRKHAGRSSNDTLFYIVEFENDKGCVVIAAPSNVKPVLAVTEAGTLDVDIENPMPSAVLFRDLATNYVKTESAKSPNVIEGPVNRQYREETREIISQDQVGPNVLVNWNQTGFYNKYCQDYPEDNEYTASFTGRRAAGCSPIAMGMALSAIKEPSSFKLSYDDSDRLINLDWDKIIDYTRAPAPNTTPPGNEGINELQDFATIQVRDFQTEDAIAYLIREIGFHAGSTHVGNGSVGTYSHMFKYVFQYLGISFDNEKAYTSCSKESLVNGSVYLVSALDTSDRGGHSFVVDGVRDTEWRCHEKIWDTGKMPWTLVSSRDWNESSHLVHVNWGWGGANNGWFLDAIFCIVRPYQFDYTNGNYNINYNFTNGIRYMKIYKS